MSCYQLGNAHINYLVNACLLYGICPARQYTPEQLGAVLADANAASVNARYAHHKRPCKAIDYAFSILPKARITPMQTIVAAQCLEYQSCDDDGWSATPAKTIIDALIIDAISLLPGYNDTQWEITD